MSTPLPVGLNIFLDSDGPVADFDGGLKASGAHADDFKHWPGIYLWLDVTRGAKAAIAKLKELDDKNLLRVWIATKTPSGSPYAYTEKILWYRKHFPWLEDRVIITHDKHLLGGHNDFLLDDRPHKANANLFKGTFVLFDPESPKKEWEKFLKQIEMRLDL